MKNIKINYHNINFDKEVPLPSNHNQIISAIKNILANMSSLNIIKNKDKLEETKSRVVNFSKNKDNFILFGTGGSNLGAKALINILSGNDDIKISFFDILIRVFDFLKLTPPTLFFLLIEIFKSNNLLAIKADVLRPSLSKSLFLDDKAILFESRIVLHE